MTAVHKNKRVAVLPASTAASSSALPLLRLPHPRTLEPTFYLPTLGNEGTSALLEVQQVKPDADKSRSWFVGQHVVSDGSMLIFTPFDPLFLIVGLLSSLPPSRASNFLSLPDMCEALTDLVAEENAKKDINAFMTLPCVIERLAACCETAKHEEETLMRLSIPTVIEIVKAKIDHIVSTLFGDLESTSLGENVSEEEIKNKPFPTCSRGLGREGAGDGKGFSEQLQLEIRRKSAIGILANYLAPSIWKELLNCYSFPALTEHAASNNTSSVLNTSYLPGRSSSSSNLEGGVKPTGGGSAAAEREKKKKAEKAKMSKGVKELQAASKVGMKKLTEMFGKRTSPRKAAMKATAVIAGKGK